MMSHGVVALVFAALTVAPFASAAQAQASPAQPVSLAIEHVTVLPMNRDTALADHTVLVSADRIVWVGRSRSARVPAGTRRVDGRGMYLLPGLADMHVHIERVDELSRFVAAGITTVRNMRGEPKHVVWRNRIAAGALVGPTIFTSGPSIGRSRWLGDRRFVRLATTADARRVVREQTEAGYDMIKILRNVSVPVYRELLEAARGVRMPVVGHLIVEVGLERSLSAGQVSLEHVDGLHQRSRVASAFGSDDRGIDDNARAIGRAGAWVGTIASSRTGRCEPPTPVVRRNIAALRRANVRMLAGSDAGIGPVRPDAALHCELATLVAAGLTPYEALATATSNPGAFAQQHLNRATVPFGTVTVGARADLLLLREDPRTDLGTLARPVGVLRRGAWLSRRD